MFTKKKRIELACLLLGLLILCYTGSYFVRLGNYKKAVADMTFTPINLNQIEDGSYTGECDVDFIYAKVEVTISNHTLTDIKLLEHRNEKGTPAEAIINTMLEKESTSVDIVTGASNSSKVIRKAAENALSTH